METGGTLGRIADVQLTRTYANGGGTATGTGTTSADTSGYHGRVGHIWRATGSDQLGAYVDYGRQRQSMRGYAEPLTQANPFEAIVTPGADIMDVGRAGFRLTHEPTRGLDFALSVVGARAFKERHAQNVFVDGIGVVDPDAPRKQTWVEYGARIGYRVTRTATLGVFVTGVAGGSTIGGQAHAGFDLKLALQ